MSLTLFNLAAQPGSGERPQGIGLPSRYAEDLRGLGNRQPGKVAELHELGGLGIMLNQPLEGLVQSKQIFRDRRDSDFRQRPVLTNTTAAMFDSAAAAGLLDKDSPHGFGRSAKKMAAAPPLRRLAIVRANQPQIGFVYQRRRLQSLAWLLVGKSRRGEFTKLIVDQWQKLLRSAGFAVFDLRDDSRDVGHDV